MFVTIAGSIFIFGGLFFFLVGTVGILRFPNVLTRIHSAAKCDTLGIFLCLIGLIIFNGLSTVSIKLILIIIFLWITNPTATQLIGKAVYFKEKPYNGQENKKNEDI